MRDRIIRHYDLSSTNVRSHGQEWYERAFDAARTLAEHAFGTCADSHVQQAAAVIAALSPRVAWPTNLKAAQQILRAAACGANQPIVAGLPGNREKAWKIALGGDPDEILGGPKVRAFYANICGDEDAVTVDVWAARAAEGRRNDRAPEGKRYKKIAQAYREAAKVLGISPRNCQAAVWVYVRGSAT